MTSIIVLSAAQHKGLIGILGDEVGMEGSLGLGELADLNVNNEGDSPINDVSINSLIFALFGRCFADINYQA